MTQNYMPLKALWGIFLGVGQRLRDERTRLGLSQPAFAALAGASKGAQQNWEKDAASPNAAALTAWAEAGADVLYILTGRRTFDVPINANAQIEAQLAGIRRDMLEPGRDPLPGEDADQAEKRLLSWHANALSSMLRYDTQLMPPELVDEVSHLLNIATNPAARTLFRAADYAQRRARRREIKEQLAGWFETPPYGETVANLLTTLALEYGVPIKFLVELVEELRDDFAGRSSDA